MPENLVITPRTPVRARWIHPSHDRLIYVGIYLYVAGPAGDFRRAGKHTPQSAALFAKKNGFKAVGVMRTTFEMDESAAPSEQSYEFRLTNRRSHFDAELSACQENVSREHLVLRSGSGLYLETYKCAVPVSTLRDGTVAGELAYLRRLATHRRRVRKDGWLGDMTRTPTATPEEHRRLKRRHEKKGREKKAIIARAKETRLQTA